MCVCFGWTHKRLVASVFVVLIIQLYDCVRSGLTVCVSVCLCLGLHMEIFTQMSWHNCVKLVFRSESTDPCWAKRCLSQVLPRPPKRTAGGRPFFVTPPSLQEELGQGVGGQLKNPSFPPFGSEQSFKHSVQNKTTPQWSFYLALSLFLTP